MSVINQMLRDLEMRQNGVIETGKNVPRARVESAKTKRSIVWVTGLTSISLIGLLSVVAIVWSPVDQKAEIMPSVHLDSLVDPITVTTIVPVSTAWEVASEVSTVRIEVAPDAKPSVPGSINRNGVGLDEWRIDTSDSVTLIELDLESEIKYEVDQSFGEVALRMRGTEISRVLSPLLLSGTPIASVRTERDGDDLIMHFSTTRPVLTQVYAVRQSDNGYRLLLALQESERNDSVQASNDNPFELEPAAAPVQMAEVVDVEKTEPKLTTEQKIDLALSDLSGSDTDEAWKLRETVVRKALSDMPEHVNARLAYAGVLVNRDALLEAEALLLEGLQYASRHVGLYISLAEIKVRSGDISGALELLKNNLAANSDAPSYIAYLAALYRDQGNNSAAVSLYRRALSMRPQEGVWWMGLGISLEGVEASPRYILQAYLKAEALTRSRPELNSFVAQRVAQLSGQ